MIAVYYAAGVVFTGTSPMVALLRAEPSSTSKPDSDEMRERLYAAIGEGRLHELVPMAGQVAGLIHDLPGAAEIVARIVREADETLAGAERLRGQR